MLTGKQRAYLRGLANTLPTIGQVGKEGVTDSVTAFADGALKARELIKLRVLDSSLMTAKEACGLLCEALSAEPVQCIGTRFVIFRRNEEKPVIELPNE